MSGKENLDSVNDDSQPPVDTTKAIETKENDAPDTSEEGKQTVESTTVSSIGSSVETPPDSGTKSLTSTSSKESLDETTLTAKTEKILDSGVTAPDRISEDRTHRATGSGSFPLLHSHQQLANVVHVDCRSLLDTSSFGESLVSDPSSKALRWQCPLCESLLSLSSEGDYPEPVCSNCGHVFSPFLDRSHSNPQKGSVQIPLRPFHPGKGRKAKENEPESLTTNEEDAVVATGINPLYKAMAIIVSLQTLVVLIILIYLSISIRETGSSENESSTNVTNTENEENAPSAD